MLHYYFNIACTSSLGAGGLEKKTASLVHQSDTILTRETTKDI